MTYEQATLDVLTLAQEGTKAHERQMLAHYEKVQEQIFADIAKFYARFLDGVNPADYYNYAIQTNRLKTLLDTVTREIVRLSLAIGDTIGAASEQALKEAYARNAYVVSSFSGMPINYAPLPSDMVKATVQGMNVSWQKIYLSFGSKDQYLPKYGTLSEILFNNQTKTIRKIRDLLTQAMASGEPYGKTEQRLRKLMDTEKYKSLRIVRTETMRTSNAAIQASMVQSEKAGVDMEKTWLTAGDASVRDDHRALDGVTIPVDQKFTTNGHSTYAPLGFGIASEDINCRCRLITKVAGINPQLRRVRNPDTGKNEVILWDDYPTWAKEHGLTE
jgi:SPP1 gp7 family putative phage head morphogenesis protein